MNEITGGSPYGATTLAGADGRSRPVSENELAIARFQGEHVATIEEVKRSIVTAQAGRMGSDEERVSRLAARVGLKQSAGQFQRVDNRHERKARAHVPFRASKKPCSPGVRLLRQNAMLSAVVIPSRKANAPILPISIVASLVRLGT